MKKPHTMPVVAIVGAMSLLGREIRDLLAEMPLPASIRLIGAEEEEVGVLTEQGGEAVIMTTLDEANLGEARLVILAGSEESSRKALEMLSRTGGGAAIIDLTSYHEDSPQSRVRAPLVEPAGYEVSPEAIQVIAHPAAIALAQFLAKLNEVSPVRRSVVHVFEPASERGRLGIGELQQQTLGLLTFKEVPKKVFDDQLSFNMLARYGSGAPESLESFEQRIERHLATLLAAQGGVPMPSLKLIQAPVFHGHSFSIWAEFDENPEVAVLEEALASEHIDVRGIGHGAPSPVGMAGQSGLAVGVIRQDPNYPRAAWFWVVADNLRIAAENGRAVARSLLGGTSVSGAA